MGEPVDDSMPMRSASSSSLTASGIVIDLGTGDGTFVYQSARENPGKYYIGIDANPKPLEKISEKIHRKPAKGGLPNVLFVQAAAHDLPPELDGVADEVHVHFPWGSLLHGVATGDPAFLRNLYRVCAPDALIEVIAGLDPVRDRAEIDRLGLPELSETFIDTVLSQRYREAGFDIVERGVLRSSEWTKLETAWAKRLRAGESRTVTYILARAMPAARQ